MRIALLIGFLFSNSLGVFAHQPDISGTILVEQEDGRWILQISSALTGFEYAIHEHYGTDSYATPEEFNQLVVKHFMEHVTIEFEKGTRVTLSNGQVRLGHETHLVFEVKGVPKEFDQVTVSNIGFEGIHQSQSTLMVMKRGLLTKRHILNEANGHRLTLVLADDQFVVQAKVAQ